MSYWQDNLEFFQKNSPDIYKKMIDENALDSNMKVSYLKDKKAFQLQKDKFNIYLSSVFDAKREAQNYLAKCDKGTGLVVLLGISSLALIKEIKQHFTHIRRLIIVEPSVNIFNCVMQNISVRDVFADYPNTDITVLLQEDLEAVNFYYRIFITMYPYEKTALVYTVAYSLIFAYESKRLIDFALNAQYQYLLTINTYQYFRYAWHINEWKNLAVEAPPFSDLKELFQQLPVIVVSAGPSLNNNINLLKEVGNRAIVVTAGSGMSILHSNGIIPHFRFCIEGNSFQDRLFDLLDVNESPLAFVNTMYHKIVNKYQNNCFEIFTSKGSPLKSYILKKLGIPKFETSSGSSVSNVAVFLSVVLGCKKVILMGQDLCFTGNKNYAEGGWTSDKENKAFVGQSDMVKLKDLYGNDVYTEGSYLSIKEALEMASDWNKKTHFINATEGGLPIKGYENKNFATVLQEDLPEPTMDIAKCIKEHFDEYKNAPNKLGFNRIAPVVEQLLKDLQKFTYKIVRMSEFTKYEINDTIAAKIKKQHEKILADEIYSKIYNSVFSAEEKSLREALAGDDLVIRKQALEDYCQTVFDMTNITKTMAQEYLSGEHRYECIWQL